MDYVVRNSCECPSNSAAGQCRHPRCSSPVEVEREQGFIWLL